MKGERQGRRKGSQRGSRHCEGGVWRFSGGGGGAKDTEGLHA
jgi:hypothetical protein